VVIQQSANKQYYHAMARFDRRARKYH
jgi:hypothetical protein